MQPNNDNNDLKKQTNKNQRRCAGVQPLPGRADAADRDAQGRPARESVLPDEPAAQQARRRPARLRSGQNAQDARLGPGSFQPPPPPPPPSSFFVSFRNETR